MTALIDAEAAMPRTRPTRRLSDAEVVDLALTLLRDPRAWAAGGLGALATEARLDAVRRAGRLLREALETV